jgi:hypothetical protein
MLAMLEILEILVLEGVVVLEGPEGVAQGTLAGTHFAALVEIFITMPLQ